jgi:hypothetical protein
VIELARSDEVEEEENEVDGMKDEEEKRDFENGENGGALRCPERSAVLIETAERTYKAMQEGENEETRLDNWSESGRTLCSGGEG